MSADIRERIGDRPVVVSMSGGKDSTAAALHMRELGIPVTAYLTADTGWEYPQIVGPRLRAWRADDSATAPEDRHHCIPIDKVIEWSRTARGGRQIELFAPPSRDWACSRFGYCETRPEPSGTTKATE